MFPCSTPACMRIVIGQKESLPQTHVQMLCAHWWMGGLHAFLTRCKLLRIGWLIFAQCLGCDFHGKRKGMLGLIIIEAVV